MLYTRKGDTGTTIFFGTKRRFPKNSSRIEALGALDELNSLLGLCKAKSKRKIAAVLDDAQNDLFIIQAEIAAAYARSGKKLPEGRVHEIEKVVDGIEKKIPKIAHFTVPGGSELSALLDYARAVSRRAERRLVTLHESSERLISESSRAYANRLSSLFYALTRLVNHRAGITETPPRYRS